MAAEKFVGKAVYSCGFNGFGQLPLVSADMQMNRVVSFPQLCTYRQSHGSLVDTLALCWSSCYICKDKDIEVHGFFSGQTTCEHKLPSSSDLQCIHCFQGSLLAVPSSSSGLLMQKDNMQLKKVEVEVKGHDDSKILSLDSTDDTVYIVRENHHVGRLEPNQIDFIYQELFSDQPVEALSCGKEHAMFLTKAGSVFSFGCGSRGQLGHGIVQDRVLKPLEIEALSALRMTSISCGGWHSAAVSEHGDLYIWGWNESGQLGFVMKSKMNDVASKNASNKESSISPDESTIHQPSTADVEVKKVPDSHIYSEASTKDDSPVTFLMSPQILDMCPPEETLIKSVSCGSRHSAAITQEGHLYTWGFGRWGQLGHGNEWTLDTPTRVKSLGLGVKFTDVYCREWNTFMLAEETT